MSAKIAVISSIIWLIGWMRPRSAGDERTGSVTSTRLGGQPRIDRRVLQRSVLRRGERLGDAVFRPLIAGPASGALPALIAPSVFSSSEIEPFLPSALTRTASIAASSPAAAISASRIVFRAGRDRTWFVRHVCARSDCAGSGQ